MKRTLTATLLACGSLGCASQRTTPPAEPGWSIYRNAKYGYEIAYPDGYEVRPARREGERDARRIRIGLKEYAAPTPVLDIELDPADSFYELGRRKTLKDMRLEVVDLELGGRPARQVVFRWVSTDEIAFVEIHQEERCFAFKPLPDWRSSRAQSGGRSPSASRGGPRHPAVAVSGGTLPLAEPEESQPFIQKRICKSFRPLLS